jgi:hypothetical protein
MEETRFEFCVTVDEKALYRFLMYHVYHSVQGLAAVFISVMALVLLALSWTSSKPAMKVLLLILGLYYLVGKPVSLRMKAKLQAGQEVFQKPLTFAVDAEKIRITQGEQQAEVPWEEVYRIVSAKQDLYLYTSRIYAYTIPKDQTGEAWKKLLALAEQKGCRIS